VGRHASPEEKKMKDAATLGISHLTAVVFSSFHQSAAEHSTKKKMIFFLFRKKCLSRSKRKTKQDMVSHPTWAMTRLNGVTNSTKQTRKKEKFIDLRVGVWFIPFCSLLFFFLRPVDWKTFDLRVSFRCLFLLFRHSSFT
jgi:hypothetical protein